MYFSEKKILLVVNPASGNKRAISFVEKMKLERHAGYRIMVTRPGTTSDEIRKEIERTSSEVAVAVGGDGTVNLVASALVQTSTVLGIVPCGSGNGLARSLGYSMNPEKAFMQILSGTVKKMDAGKINNRFFFCTAGIGFDAEIAHAFAAMKNRGFLKYIQTSCRKIFSYKGFEADLSFPGYGKKKYFLITAGNAPQFGNDFFITPKAKLNDGQLDLCMLNKFAAREIPFLLWDILRHKVDSHRACDYYKGKEFFIQTMVPQPCHLDGEPAGKEKEFFLEVAEQVVKVVAPVEKYFLS